MTFKNLKIAITDETHLKAVCEVLESIGYKPSYETSKAVIAVYTDSFGYYHTMSIMGELNFVNLSDLLKMRDDMVKANAKISKGEK